MVMGIFIAMMLCGLIWYVWGIGGAILYRERMQDCTDTAVFSAAVVHARGMNILVLLNLIMGAMAAIEAGLHTAADGIEYAAWAAFFTCLGCGPWCGYCCRACPYVGPYFSASRTADRIHRAAERIISPLMRFAHSVAVGVRAGTPIAAQSVVLEWPNSSPYYPTTQYGAMFPLYRQLAAEDDPTNWPCDNKVYNPALVIAGTASLIEINFNVSEWYGLGMALAWAIDHRDNSRRFCPDYFQRVKQGAELGEEDFQIRALVYGQNPYSKGNWALKGVAVADWGRSEGRQVLTTALEPLTVFAVAQAEYFYDNQPNHRREEWLWHQRWRARLRRFRLPEGGDEGGLGGALGSLGTAISSVVIH